MLFIDKHHGGQSDVSMVCKHVHSMCMYMFLDLSFSRDSTMEVCIKRKEEEVKFQDNLKSEKNYYMSKGEGRLKWLPGGTQHKKVLLLSFNYLHAEKTGRGSPYQPWASSIGQPRPQSLVWAEQGVTQQTPEARARSSPVFLSWASSSSCSESHHNGKRTDWSCLVVG